MNVCDKTISMLCPTATPYLQQSNDKTNKIRVGFICVAACTTTVSVADAYNVCICTGTAIGFTPFAPNCSMPDISQNSRINFCKFNAVYVATNPSTTAPVFAGTLGSCTQCAAYINLVPLYVLPTPGLAVCATSCPTNSFVNNFYGSMQCVSFC